MELPFAVESSAPAETGNSLQHSESSLVTASSQGSFVDSSTFGSPLLPNRPQDVILPRYSEENKHNAPQRVEPLRPQAPGQQDDIEVIDFTYVNVSEQDADDVGFLTEVGEIGLQPDDQKGDILSILLSGMHSHDNDVFLEQAESANEAASKAAEAKRKGDLPAALEFHTRAAKLYRENAITIRDRNASLATSLLLLSQTQAKSAMALSSIVKLGPSELQQSFPLADTQGKPVSTSSAMSHKDRLRAAVRGALGSRPHEADISDSQFLGKATSGPLGSKLPADVIVEGKNADSPGGSVPAEASRNPVDEMMELERELRDMDMALELGNSITSLDTRMQNRMKSSMVEGSFMVVPPGSNSYMSSSMWGANPVPSNNVRPPPVASNTGTAGVRARANRVQPILDAKTGTANRQAHATPTAQSKPADPSSQAEQGLEYSWWGNAGTASQLLSSSVVSLGASRSGDPTMSQIPGDPHQQTNTKQLMRLMDSLKTLGDENAALLREVEDAEAARQEAKAARAEMKQFQEQYQKKFVSLNKALKKFMQEYPPDSNTDEHPIASSEFHKSSSTADQLQRQEQLIRKLTADLKKEKEESKKKDIALRKYENFYREVKQRSAQKAAQKTHQQRQHKSPRVVTPSLPR
eukprot:Nitzschia sp. Nitz4//scaffold3_size479765//241155//243275//NITZ4_000102-RA/size479765-processed-gene-1.459-mRNA-1//1//CDS//3329550764//1462//frame0